MPAAVKVVGLRELNRDFNAISDELGGDLRDELADAAEPVAALSETFALERIRNMPKSPEWAEMRIGVSRREALVYMVPDARSRGRGRGKRKRKNLADLLSERAMDPAMDAKEEEVVERVEDLLDDLGRKHNF